MPKKSETAKKNENEIVKPEKKLTHSERFVNMVEKEFSANVAGKLTLTNYQKSLVQGYFITVDRVLKNAEEERLRKNANNKDHKFDNNLPVIWENINRTDLALDVIHFAKMGLDMMQPNHLFPIPFKNNKKSQYDITLMPGYNGLRYIAEKYATHIPLSVTVEVVYSTDKFIPIKKSASNSIENYEFEITNPFDRGDIVGGFAYIEHVDKTKNELIIMSMKDIEKRKPKHASANFWGGTTKEWQNGKQVEVDADGWLDEMVRKTIIREAYSAKHLPRDPKKIDDAYKHMKLKEVRYAEIEARASIDVSANTILIDSDSGEIISEDYESSVNSVPIESSVTQAPLEPVEEVEIVEESKVITNADSPFDEVSDTAISEPNF